MNQSKQSDPDFINKKIVIASAARDHDWYNEAVMSFANIVSSVPLGCMSIVGIESNFIHVARNIIFSKAQESEADYLATIDSDVVLISSPAPVIPYLIKQSKKYKADMIGGIILRNHAGVGLAPDVFNVNHEGHMVPIDTWPKEMTSVDGVGASFLFLTKRLIQAFTPEKIREFGNPFDFTHQSEDFAFCTRVKKLGFKIFVDPTIGFGHKKAMTLTKESWKPKNRLPEANPPDTTLISVSMAQRPDSGRIML
jgi:hypothetical protein